MRLYSKWLAGNLVIYPGGQGGGVEYFVDGNAGLDTNDGLSWDAAFKTMAVGLAASHANIASGAAGWAARNKVYCKGDAFVENLVLLAQKTDIIGVGSYNQFPRPGLTGNHVPISATGIGVRFFNFHFNAASGDIFTLDSSQRGIEFHNCYFDATPTCTGAIMATAVWFLKIYNCHFVGDFTDAVIELGAGNAQGLEIVGNYIEGDNQGIDFDAATTCSPNKVLIADNKIHTATECINDEASIAAIMNNTCETLQAKGVGGAGAIVADEFLCGGNKISASDLANADYPALGAL